ncbi:MAG: SusC/RagA family TonB-linked outer membrane protein [Barnesiella sp.]|nr:SusC/RagA family TonB-linked outer membrane protein [Barnesiella sp.]
MKAKLTCLLFCLMMLPMVAFAQSTKVTGTVTDKSGEPLIGVSVIVKGTQFGTQTNIDGEFSINAKQGDVLKFSYIGYKSQEVTVHGASSINVVLEDDSKTLDEVVVTALGIKKEAKSLSYNVQKVGNEELTRIADANFVNNLNGKVAGVTINSSSAGVGGGARVVMRGAKSISGNNNALYVVDGIPMLDMSRAATQPEGVYEGASQTGDPLSAINPDDIENISVLSGPSAAALYGSAAANGVVMITTKKGTEGQTRVTISNNTTFQRVAVLPDFQTSYGASETGSYLSWGSKLPNKSSFRVADFFQTGYNVTNSASLTTGTQRNQTYLSIGTTNAEGVVHNNDYSRYNATVRNTTKMANDKLTMDLAFMLSQINEKNMTSQGLYYNPLVPLYLFPAGEDFRQMQSYQRYNAERGLMDQYFPYSSTMALQNPYWITENLSMPNKKNRYNASAQFRYEFADWINVTARAKIDRDNESRERKFDAGTNTQFASKYGYYSKQSITNQQVYGELLASINKYFNDHTWDLTANVGANFENTDYQSDWFGGNLATVANKFTFSNVDLNGRDIARQDGYNLKKRAIFGTVQLGYRSMAYLDLSARNDWSSTFKGTNTNSFFYPSVGLSGIITDIFNIQSRALNFAKVRVSYSEVGNSPEVFIAIPTYEIKDGAVVTQTRRPNSNLRPERTKAWEAGINLAMFDNALRLDATLYTSSTYNQFFERQLAGSTGYTSEIFNGGRVDNRGIELSLRYSKQWGDFLWSSYLTYSINRNKVKELAADYIDPYTGEPAPLTEMIMASTSMYQTRVTEGGSIGDIYVNTLRTDEHGAIYVHPNDQTIVTEPNNFVKVGNASPRYNLGWGNDLRFKGFNLGFLVTARVGGVGVSQTQAVLDYYGASQATADARDNGGVLVNGRPIPAQDFYQKVGSPGQSGGIGSLYVYSATNVRLSELTFGYDFPVQKWGSFVKGLNLSFIGKNLFFFYKKAPYDPEMTASTGTYMQGIDNFMSPSLRSLGFSLKVQF